MDLSVIDLGIEGPLTDLQGGKTRQQALAKTQRAGLEFAGIE